MTAVTDSTETFRTGRPEHDGRESAIAEMLKEPAAPAAAPADLAAACRWAARRRSQIDQIARDEDWSDEKFDVECEIVDAVFVRAIEEPSRNAFDVSAKASLALQDFESFVFPGPMNKGEDEGNDGERIVHTVLREMAALEIAEADDDPVTIESMAALDFEAYSFDEPPSSRSDWITKFAPFTLGLAMAEKFLRMSKSEIVTFLRTVTDTDQRDALNEALLSSQKTMRGWADFADLAHTRMLIAASVLATEEAGSASAAVEA